jgi:hypothetical protein
MADSGLSHGLALEGVSLADGEHANRLVALLRSRRCRQADERSAEQPTRVLSKSRVNPGQTIESFRWQPGPRTSNGGATA